MTPERWQLVRGILDSAMELHGKDRVAFLDSQCAGDPSLREDVELHHMHPVNAIAAQPNDDLAFKGVDE